MIKKVQKHLSLIILISMWLFIFITPVFAHPGRTDRYGCHTCRTNCAKWGLSYGEYHCHRSKDLPQPKPPKTKQPKKLKKLYYQLYEKNISNNFSIVSTDSSSF